MTTLQSKVIKLAHDHPELRQHLVPILRRAAEKPLMQIGPSVRNWFQILVDGPSHDGPNPVNLVTEAARLHAAAEKVLDNLFKVRGRNTSLHYLHHAADYETMVAPTENDEVMIRLGVWVLGFDPFDPNEGYETILAALIDIAHAAGFRTH